MTIRNINDKQENIREAVALLGVHLPEIVVTSKDGEIVGMSFWKDEETSMLYLAKGQLHSKGSKQMFDNFSK